MKMFNSEEEMLEIIEQKNQIICRCLLGEITFNEFLNQYEDFYFYYALDGNESDLQERELFEKHEDKIALHREIMGVLSGLCSDEDAVKEIYKKAGRFGSKEALNKLKAIFSKYSTEEN